MLILQISNIKLNILTIAKFHQNLTRLRVSSHRLEVECGRWTRVYTELRKRLNQ